MFRAKKTRLAVLALSVSVLLLSFFSCTKTAECVWQGGERNAAFTAVFPDLCETGAVTCEVTRTGDKLSFVIVEPERSAGVRIERDGSSCVLYADDSHSIALSPAVSANLDALYRILYEAADATVTRTEDGVGTVLSSLDGRLTLDCDLVPVSVSVLTDCGEQTVEISDYRFLPTAEE